MLTTTITCACGCGEPLPVARYPSQQARFVAGHQARGKKRTVETREKIAAALRGRERSESHCRNLGDAKRGKPTGPISDLRRERISAALKGRVFTEEHRRNISKGRLAIWAREQPSYQAIHKWLRRNFPKTGICEHCGERGSTDYAFLYHPAPHTRNREDYIELCNDGCHQRFDRELRAC